MRDGVDRCWGLGCVWSRVKCRRQVFKGRESCGGGLGLVGFGVVCGVDCGGVGEGLVGFVLVGLVGVSGWWLGFGDSAP